METYIIGSILKEYRTRLKISQEDLSTGLCDMSTLSRIESGKQIPGRKLVEGLFSKMGMSLPSMGLPMKAHDFKRENIEYKITNLVANENLEIMDLLEEYKNCDADMGKLEQQFYIFFKALAEDVHEHNGETAILKYIEALKLTVYDYELDTLPTGHLLTRMELMILNNIARTQYFIGNVREAIELMEFLRSYFETKVLSEGEKASNYPVILFNLENWYGKQDDDEKCLELCEIGIATCKQYGKYGMLPYHIFNKGYSLVKVGKKEEGKRCMERAFIIMEEMGFCDDVVYGKKSVAETFGITF